MGVTGTTLESSIIIQTSFPTHLNSKIYAGLPAKAQKVMTRSIHLWNNHFFMLGNVTWGRVNGMLMKALLAKMV